MLFEDGGRISEVSRLSDFLAVRIYKLPGGNLSEPVMTMLTDLDFEVPVTRVGTIWQNRSLS
jgi:hypothetical protein